MPDPLFLTDEKIAEILLGPGRLREWRALAIVLERSGLPQIDPMFGGRYWPAVRAWFDRRHGLTTIRPAAKTDGSETWQSSRSEPEETGKRPTTGGHPARW